MNPETNPRSKITSLLPTCNEEDNILDCISTILWTDEIFVVDSFSGDRTPELARKAGARVVQHEYVNSATQKNWAIPQCKTEWVLIVDSDERVTHALQREIIEILRADHRNPGSVKDGYRISRMNHFMGKPVRYCGWQNDTCLRLFRTKQGRYQGREVHADVIIDGETGTLQGKLTHYTFTSFQQYMKKFDRYTTWAAGDRYLVTGKVGWQHLILRPAARFLKQYFLKRGFLDGRVGLIICGLSSFSVFMKYAKLWEKRMTEPARKPETPGADPESHAEKAMPVIADEPK
jgi:glycosyltransferase involved in cell wall biosynthesis